MNRLLRMSDRDHFPRMHTRSKDMHNLYPVILAILMHRQIHISNRADINSKAAPQAPPDTDIREGRFPQAVIFLRHLTARDTLQVTRQTDMHRDSMHITRWDVPRKCHPIPNRIWAGRCL